MTYQETLDFMFAQLPMYHRIGAAAYKADLQPTIDMMAALGNPENRFKSIHVACTNGKGSVSHFLASILQEAGYRVGLYTSPHLVDFRERIRINGDMIPQSEVVDFVDRHRAMFADLHLSFFEMTVGLAFDYFASQKVDIAVVEVGMGGRLDSTNVITPLLSVITNIGLDHTQFLGNTLEKIAGEKAGIIKEGVPVVIGETQPETKPVFERVAAERHAPITFADQHWHVRTSAGNRDESRLLFDVERRHPAGNTSEPPQPDVDRRHPAGNTSPEWRCGLVSQLAGSYQLKNLATVFEAVRQLPLPLNGHIVERGIAHVVDNTHLHGRWQVIANSPLTICETAHNAPGIDAMLGKLATMHFARLHVIYGCVNDKDYRKILTHLHTEFAKLGKPFSWRFSQPSVPRQLPVADLQSAARDLGIDGPAFPNVKDAIADAQQKADDQDLVFVTGSIFLIADALAD
ncbi:MAG: bifunctional folylpolyglutamate synthase/dihydrofolate synthase [Bacteroidales bacterium]|nr:bifunctional folylpolyglutamate synthase/dihydrofolate synthase [Bacteroidales bacterium]